MRPETITFLRKEAKEILKTLPPSIGITEDQIFKKLKDEWKDGNRLDDEDVEKASSERCDSYKHVVMENLVPCWDKKINGPCERFGEGCIGCNEKVVDIDTGV
jgi:hypothetical protein